MIIDARTTANERDDVALAAGLTAPVLITGAQSAQRETCARLIHASGVRVRGPFVVIPADSDTCTFWQRADAARGGTLFVDNVDALSAAHQSALEHLLDLPDSIGAEHDCSRLRIISAGTVVWRLCERKRFSIRLFYRLNVIHIDLDRAQW